MAPFPPRPSWNSKPSPQRRGFSLIEVTLALGISATALLVVFSLMPIGMTSLQDTQRQIVEAEIYNKIGAELATTATFDKSDPATRQNLLNKYCSDRFPACFDAEGNELARTEDTKIPPLTVFIARCGVEENRTRLESTWSPAKNFVTKDELLLGTVQIGYNSVEMRRATAILSTDNKALPAAVRQRTFLLANHGS